jgi:hypothetical protein
MKRGYKFGNWTRHKTKAGYRYFYKGKPKSGKAFKKAEKNYAFKKASDSGTKETTRQRWGKKAGKNLGKRLKKNAAKPSKQKSFKIGSVEHFGKLCTMGERSKFYRQVLADRKVLQGKLSDESYSALRVVIEMHGKKTKQKHKTGHSGKRSFRDLRNLKNFLDVSDYGRSEVDWDETTGMCKYKKSAKLVMVKLRGDRVTGEKIYRRYTFDE